MTPKQIERTRKRIADIKRFLASERKKFGAYDDSRGLRYTPTKYYVQLADYAGGLRYSRWFDKNFPDDSGVPEFLFERAIILFKCGKTKDAAQMAFQTYCSNSYWFDKFYGKELTLSDMWHYSNLTLPEYTVVLQYSCNQLELADFSKWLAQLITREDFRSRCVMYVDIYKKLKTETDKKIRHSLLKQSYKLLEMR